MRCQRLLIDYLQGRHLQSRHLLQGRHLHTVAMFCKGGVCADTLKLGAGGVGCIPRSLLSRCCFRPLTFYCCLHLGCLRLDGPVESQPASVLLSSRLRRDFSPRLRWLRSSRSRISCADHQPTCTRPARRKLAMLPAKPRHSCPHRWRDLHFCGASGERTTTLPLDRRGQDRLLRRFSGAVRSLPVRVGLSTH